MIKYISKIFVRILIVLLLIVTLILTLVQVPAVQSYIISKYVLPELKNTFGTDIKVKEVSITFFGDILLSGVTAQDHHNQLLMEIKEARLNPDILKLIKTNATPLDLEKIKLYEPKVYVKVYKGETKANFIQFVQKFKSKHPSGKTTIVDLDAEIKDGFCEIYNYNFEPKERQYVLNASGINLIADNLHVVDNDITADIKKFTANATNSHNYPLVIKNLAGKFIHKVNQLAINDLTLESDKSSLKGSFEFFYEDEQTAFSDFNNLVNWKVDFNSGSNFNTADLQYFVPTWNHHVNLDVHGKVRGQLSRLVFENIDLKALNTKIQGKRIVLDHVYESDQFKIQADDNTFVTTSYKDLVQILPANINTKIPKLLNNYGQMALKGNLDFTKKSLYTKSELSSTTLGKAIVDATLTNYSTSEIAYKGKIKTQGFDLQKLTGSNKLGKVSGDLVFDGSGKKLETLKIKSKGTIQSIQLLGKTLNNIQLDGALVNKRFDGIIKSNDPNARFDFEGGIDFSSSKYDADFNVKLINFNLYRWGITSDKNARLTSNVTVKLIASNLDDLLGQIVFENTIYKNSVQSLAFQQMLINSTFNADNERVISINSDEIAQGYIQGHFKLSQIANITRNAFGKLIPNYQPRPMLANQNFKFDFSIRDYFFEIFFPEITINPGTHLVGEITDENQLILKTETTGLTYGKYELGPAQVTINTKNPFFQTSLKSDWMNVQGYKLKDVRLLTINNNDTIDIKSKFKGNFGGQSEQEFGLNFFATKTKEGRDWVGFKKSTIKYNDNEWVINPNDEKDTHYAILDLKKKEYYINKVLIESGEQKLEINGSYLKNFLALNLDVENTKLEGLLPPLKGVSLKGLANGVVKVKYSPGNFEPIADFKISNFELNNYLVGDVNANVALEGGLYRVNSSIEKDALKGLVITGNINPKSTDNYLDLKVKMDNFGLGLLNPFLKGVMEKVRGNLTGEAELTGTLKKPEYQGLFTLDKGGMKISYLGTDYDILGQPEILVSTGLIHFYDEIRLKDVKYGTQAKLAGMLEHENFVKWTLKNIFLRSDRVLVLDTDYNQNPLFYGKVFAKDLVAKINGPATNLDISILAVTGPGSQLTVNTGGSNLDATQAVKFVKLGEVINPKPFQLNEKGEMVLPEIKGLNLSIAADITPDAQFELIIDKKTDNKMVAQGTGNITLDMNLAGKMEMNGEVKMTGGYYNFVFEKLELIRKRFKVRPGSSIVWSGDMFNPKLDIGTYVPTTVSNVSEYLGSNYSQTIDVELQVNIDGYLTAPVIGYNVVPVDAPESVKNSLQNKFSDKDEETNQFASVLMMNRFVTSDSKNVATVGVTNQFVSLLTGRISAMLSNLTNFARINAQYIQGNPAYNTADALKINANLLLYKLSPALSPRISLDLATQIPIETTGNAAANARTTFSGEIQYDISSGNDGTFKLKAFRRPTTFGLDNFNASSEVSFATGAGIYYHEEFRSFRDFRNKFLRRKEKYKKLDSIDNARQDSLRKLKRKNIKDTVK